MPLTLTFPLPLPLEGAQLHHDSPFLWAPLATEGTVCPPIHLPLFFSPSSPSHPHPPRPQIYVDSEVRVEGLGDHPLMWQLLQQTVVKLRQHSRQLGVDFPLFLRSDLRFLAAFCRFVLPVETVGGGGWVGAAAYG